MALELRGVRSPGRFTSCYFRIMCNKLSSLFVSCLMLDLCVYTVVKQVVNELEELIFLVCFNLLDISFHSTYALLLAIALLVVLVICRGDRVGWHLPELSSCVVRLYAVDHFDILAWINQGLLMALRELSDITYVGVSLFGLNCVFPGPTFVNLNDTYVLFVSVLSIIIAIGVISQLNLRCRDSYRTWCSTLTSDPGIFRLALIHDHFFRTTTSTYLLDEGFRVCFTVSVEPDHSRLLFMSFFVRHVIPVS